MRRSEAADDINKRLIEAVASLRSDMERVELWAAALSGFSRPVPEYKPQVPELSNGGTNGLLRDVPMVWNGLGDDGEGRR